MAFDFKFEHLAHGFFSFVESGVAKFENFSAIEADEVVVLPAAIGFFEDGGVLAELVSLDEFAFVEQFQGIIDCGAADVVVVLLHEVVKLVGIEVVVAAIDFFEYGEAFGCAAQFVFEQVLLKDFFGGIGDFLVVVGFHIVVSLGAGVYSSMMRETVVMLSSLRRPRMMTLSWSVFWTRMLRLHSK